ncbi:hypothetical protein B0T17DRAFT_595684 [Bombardia bombarda]|uniref:VIT domain-containing protein n=1 Tax=Bombardia bombarda TaxID=252184 RepID=A0AA39XLB9_9PEZI|nr:hypothetical protein B0T17DRAFT_595684 [Bombardia bombarda]
MSHLYNTFFAGGIVWDPREPWPEELQNENPTGSDQSGYPRPHVMANFHQSPPVVSPLTSPHPLLPEKRRRSESLENSRSSKRSKKAKPVIRIPSLTVQESSRNVLPPLSISIDASVLEDTARVTVTQVFSNDSDSMIKEAAYLFPLRQAVPLPTLAYRIGTSTLIKGQVRPRDEDRQIRFEKEHPANFLDEMAIIRKEAENIACKWSLLSKWTSLFLVEEPYKPVGDATFVDGSGGLRGSPGVDLLTPRGIARITVPADNSHILKDYQQQQQQQQKLPEFQFGPMDLGAEIQDQDSSGDFGYVTTNNNNPAPQAIIKPLSVQSGYNVDEIEALRNEHKCIKEVPQRSVSNVGEMMGLLSDTASPATGILQRRHVKDNRRDFINWLLACQKFDGCIALSAIATRRGAFEKYTHGIVGTVFTVMKNNDNLSYDLINTAVMVVLLERDFISYKPLWQLIHYKASNYIKNNLDQHASQEDFLETVRRTLEMMAEPESVGDDGEVEESEDGSRRVLVERAPVE